MIRGLVLPVRMSKSLSPYTNDKLSCSIRQRHISTQKMSWLFAEINSSNDILLTYGSPSRSSGSGSTWSYSSYYFCEESPRFYYLSNVDMSEVIVDEDISKPCFSERLYVGMSLCSFPTVGTPVNKQSLALAWWLPVPFLYLISKLSPVSRNLQRIRWQDYWVMFKLTTWWCIKTVTFSYYRYESSFYNAHTTARHSLFYAK